MTQPSARSSAIRPTPGPGTLAASATACRLTDACGAAR